MKQVIAQRKTVFALVGIVGVAGLVGLAITGAVSRGRAADTRQEAAPDNSPQASTKSGVATRPDPVAPALAEYRVGNYEAAEAEVVKFLRSTAQTTTNSVAPSLAKDTPVRLASLKPISAEKAPHVSATGAAEVTRRKDVLRARQVLAFSAARRNDMKRAREQFALVRTEAASAAKAIPEVAARPISTDGPAATLEENAAYQHAVCTAALGDKAGAEKEWVAFMRTYPESPLVHASVKRIARLHGGDIPKEAEDAWKQAMATARDRETERQRLASLCGPECLAELLKRQGKDDAGESSAVSVERLAQEMKTSPEGTTLAAMADAAQKHGFPEATGYALTAKGLAAQQLPVIVLIAPGHYVLVEKISADGAVTFWDPNGGGRQNLPVDSLPLEAAQPVTQTVTAAQWEQVWKGITLILHRQADEQGAEKTAKTAGKTR